MTILIYHVDAFTNQLFSGNPAMVCILENWLPDASLQTLAREHNLPATAFLVEEKSGLSIRWFTPEYEIDLCGHGTLAASYIIFTKLHPTLNEVTLHSQSGLLTVTRHTDFIELDFPAKHNEPFSAPSLLSQGLGGNPIKTYHYKNERCLVVYAKEQEIKALKPDMSVLRKLDYPGIIVTAPGDTIDFVSRVFYPKKHMSEDAVTGSSHCLLVPYWAKRLNKNKFQAAQLSARGGQLFCELAGDRVKIRGQAILYMEGTLTNIKA